MTELAIQNATLVQPEQSAAVGQLMQHAQAMSAAYDLATKLSNTSLVPQMYQKKPDEATAAILYGAELGLNPIQSLQQIFVVQGKPAIYARTMVALVKTRGYTIETIDTSDESVTVQGTDPRTGLSETSTWTYDRAKRAGYTTNKKYDTDPQGMLYAKAATEVCRKLAPEVLLGIAYSREELELEPKSVKVKSERVQSGTAGLRDHLGVKTGDVPDVSDHATVEMITKAQLAKLATEFSDKGLSNRDEGLAYLGNIVGHDVKSSKDLTKDEASKVLDELAKVNEPANDGEPA
jgi:hypothetical protein